MLDAIEREFEGTFVPFLAQLILMNPHKLVTIISAYISYSMFQLQQEDL